MQRSFCLYIHKVQPCCIPRYIRQRGVLVSQFISTMAFADASYTMSATSLYAFLLFISAFRRADELATAMECRCYQGGAGRTKMKLLRYTQWDFKAFGVAAVVLAAVCLLRSVGL